MKTKAMKAPNLKIILSYLKCVMIALSITFASIIIFAFIIKWTNLADNFISPVNMGIKALSVFLGALVLTKGKSHGIVNGIIFGLVYTLLSFSIFSILAKKISLSLGLVADFAFTSVVGAAGGIIGVNLKPKS